MKRFLLVGIILMVSAGLVFGASRLVTSSATSTTTTPAYAIAVAQKLAKPIIATLTIRASDADADVVVMDGNGTVTVTSAALAATATSVTVGSCTGLNGSTQVVISDRDGTPSEVLAVSGCTGSNLVFTAASNTYLTRATINEIDTLYTYSNVGLGTQTIVGDPFIVGFIGGPMVVKVTAATGTATVDLTVDYR